MNTNKTNNTNNILTPIDRNGLLFLPTGNEQYDATLVLGYLLDGGEEHGIYDAHYGRINATTEQCNKHNQLFDKMMIDGLANCQVGQHGTLYHRVETKDGKQHHTVTTFLGNVIAETGKNGFAVFVHGKSIRFQYTPNIIGKHVSPDDRMMFRGTLRKDQNAFNFKRVV